MQAALQETHSHSGLALSTDSAIGLMSKLNLVTPAIFDYFLMTLMAWYQEECASDNVPPNLFPIFDGGHRYSAMFLEIFIDGFAEQYCRHHNQPLPSSIDFTTAQKTELSRMFMSNIDSMQRPMLDDFQLTLDAMNMTYVWDATIMKGVSYMLYKNNPVVEVW
jgi:hypothetical protein